MDVYYKPSLGSGGTGTSGDPYGSWTDMIAGMSAPVNLTTLAEVINLYVQGVASAGNASSRFLCSELVSTPTSSYYLHIQPWSGFEGTGAFGTKPGFSNGASTQSLFYMDINYTRVTDIEIYNTRDGSNNYLAVNWSAANCLMDRCILRATRGISISTGDNNIVRSTILHTRGDSASGIEVNAGSNGNEAQGVTTIFGGTTSTGNAFYANLTSGTVNLICKGCLAYGSWSGEYVEAGGGTFPAGSTNNAGQIASGSQPTQIQTNYLQLTSDPFTNAASNDYTPAVASDIIGAGVAVTGMTYDVAGTAYATPPSIGAYESTAGGGISIPIVMHHRRMMNQ